MHVNRIDSPIRGASVADERPFRAALVAAQTKGSSGYFAPSTFDESAPNQRSIAVA